MAENDNWETNDQKEPENGGSLWDSIVNWLEEGRVRNQQNRAIRHMSYEDYGHPTQQLNLSPEEVRENRNERFAVEGALVVCINMEEDTSISEMQKTESGGKIVNGALALVHKDITFEPLFTGCKCTGDDCDPDIEGYWQGFEERDAIDGGYGILASQAFMLCNTGCGVLYITEDGQRLSAGALELLLMRTQNGRNWLAAHTRDPVNLATGNFIYEHVDIRIETGHPLKPLEFCRFYNSMDSYDGVLGRNWFHNYNIRLTIQEDGDIVILFGDGKEEMYPLDEIGGYGSPVGNYSNLIREEGGYLLKYPDDSSISFSKKGEMILQCDNHGNEIVFTYDKDKLIQVSSKGGSLSLEYVENYISAVYDHTGRAVHYTYDKEICFPYEVTVLTSFTDTLGNTYQYEYDNLKRIAKITHPDDYISVENNYDELNRTTWQRLPDGGEMYYSYDEKGKTTELTETDGSVSIYKRDDLYRTTGIVASNGEERFKYNEKNQLLATVDKLGNETKYSYDEEGNIASITNPLGIVTIFNYAFFNQLSAMYIDGDLVHKNEYDEERKLLSVGDALGQLTTLEYNKRGAPVKIGKPDGSERLLFYDERGNITKVIDITGVETSYEYDLSNRVISTKDGNGNETRYEYNSENNITKVKNAAGDVRLYTYNTMNKVSSITDFDGSIVRWEYGELTYPTVFIDQLGRETCLSYDSLWNLTEIVMPNKGVIKYLHNQFSQLETVIKPNGSEIQYQYDAIGNCIAVIDEEGNQTNFSYDAASQLTEVNNQDGTIVSYTYNPKGQVTSITNGLGDSIYLVYDEIGQLVQETNSLGDSRYYIYSLLGKIESIIDEADRKTKYEYKRGGLLTAIHHPDGTTESYTYDSNGNISTYSDKYNQTTHYAYDCLNRVVQVKKNPDKSRVGQEIQTEIAYDSIGNILSITDAMKNVTRYEYTATGKLSKVVDALGHEVSYTYDEMDQLTEIRQYGDGKITGEDVSDVDMQQIGKSNSKRTSSFSTRYNRNVMGHITSIIDALGQEERFKYDKKGQLIEKIDKDGYLTKYAYNVHGDMNHIQYADGREVKMSYSPLRLLEEIEDWLGVTKIERDKLGRVTRVIDSKNQPIEYTWGPTGAKESITYPSGKKVLYCYDELVRLKEVQEGEIRINYDYDNLSRLREKTYPNHVRTSYRYNEFNELQGVVHERGSESLDSYSFFYDLNGNTIGLEKRREGISEERNLFYYSYDALNQLNSVKKDDNIIRSYKYDARGNRTKMIEGDKEKFYIYNDLNQLVSAKDYTGNLTYNYDRRGNIKSVQENGKLVNKYYYGALNSLEKTYNYKTNKGAIYQYDGLTRRIGREEGNVAGGLLKQGLEHLELNPSNQINDVLDFTRHYNNVLERNENNQITSYTWDKDLLLMNKGEKSAHQYLLDRYGSPVRMLDNEGAVQGLYDYDEFGRELFSQTTENQPFTYTGYQKDEVSGTYYAQAREYWPAEGRFVSPDIMKGNLVLPFTLNEYGYCWNRPLNLVDLDGMVPQDSDEQDEPEEENPRLRADRHSGIPAEHWPWNDPFWNWGSDIIVSGGGNYGVNNQTGTAPGTNLVTSTPSVGWDVFYFYGGLSYLEIEGDRVTYRNENWSVDGRLSVSADFIGASLGARAFRHQLGVRAFTFLCRAFSVGGTLDIGALGATAGFNPDTGEARAGLAAGIGGSVSLSTREVGFSCICCDSD